MKALNKDDMDTVEAFIKKDKRFWLMCWHLMCAKHQIGGDMPAVMFFI